MDDFDDVEIAVDDAPNDRAVVVEDASDDMAVDDSAVVVPEK